MTALTAPSELLRAIFSEVRKASAGSPVCIIVPWRLARKLERGDMTKRQWRRYRGKTRSVTPRRASDMSANDSQQHP